MFGGLHEPIRTTAVTAGGPLWVINWHAQGEDISSAPAQESGRCRALPRPPLARRTGEGCPMSAYRYQ
jgi:hypothetical protein